MNTKTTRYSLQFRPIPVTQTTEDGSMELEIFAEPEGPGQPIRARARQWLPVFDRLCTLLSSSPFHRKAMHRTLQAGVPMQVVDRTDGSKLMFSAEQIAALTFEKSSAA